MAIGGALRTSAPADDRKHVRRVDAILVTHDSSPGARQITDSESIHDGPEELGQTPERRLVRRGCR